MSLIFFFLLNTELNSFHYKITFKLHYLDLNIFFSDYSIMYTGQHYLMSNLESLQHYLQVFGSASFPHHLILKLKEHPHHHFESYGLVHLY